MSVVKEWISNLSLKQQTVLLSALRGCDTVDKHDVSKLFIRKLRSVILNNACPNEGDFMQDTVTDEVIYNFTKSLDKYPFHFLMHFIHAVEIIGYKHPDENTKLWWNNLYKTIVNSFHMNIETEEQCDYRLRDGVPTICHKT